MQKIHLRDGEIIIGRQRDHYDIGRVAKEHVVRWRHEIDLGNNGVRCLQRKTRWSIIALPIWTGWWQKQIAQIASQGTVGEDREGVACRGDITIVQAHGQYHRGKRGASSESQTAI